jgi:hypothetical protein
MSIVRAPGTCIIVHLDEGEAHLPTPERAQEWAADWPEQKQIRAIEPAQMPCWTAECDTPDCVGCEDDENGNTMHFLAATADDAEQQLSDLQRQPDGRLLCTMCRDH